MEGQSTIVCGAERFTCAGNSEWSIHESGLDERFGSFPALHLAMLNLFSADVRCRLWARSFFSDEIADWSDPELKRRDRQAKERSQWQGLLFHDLRCSAARNMVWY